MKPEKHIRPTDYARLFSEVKERVRSAQYDALKTVNLELIGLYWDIGQMIGERQRGETWGKAVVANLASDLQREFPGMQGFSAQNLWRMRQFYLTYASSEKLSPLVREISWTKNVIVLMRCKDPNSDIWQGSAVELAGSHLIAVHPAVGWWRERHHLNRWNKQTRYSLVVSIHLPEQNVDIYTPVSALVGVSIPVPISIPVA